ncbi:MAG: hypothetical protein KDB53_01275 [Planctomycetes bacterium]|nr:hypothetical protein [Planctomycetota bacterium]
MNPGIGGPGGPGRDFHLNDVPRTKSSDGVAGSSGESFADRLERVAAERTGASERTHPDPLGGLTDAIHRGRSEGLDDASLLDLAVASEIERAFEGNIAPQVLAEIQAAAQRQLPLQEHFQRLARLI